MSIVQAGSPIQGFGSPKIRRACENDDLELYVEQLKKVRSLTDITDIGKTLSRNGRNILHLIAAEPDFSIYEKLMHKHCKDKRFIQLLTQTTADAQTPFHVVCQKGNVPMLVFLLQIPDDTFLAPEEHPRFWLQEMGKIKTESSGNNVFHCLCDKNEMNTLGMQASSVRLFDALVELYGEKEAARLASEKNRADKTLLDLSKACGNIALVQKVTELFAMQWRELQLEHSSGILQ